MVKLQERQSARRLFLLAVVLATAGCDRATKHLATTNLAGAAVQSYFGDIVRLQYAENPGAFMSLGTGLPDWARTSLLTFGAGLGLVAVTVAAIKLRWTGLPLIGAILFITGGASNLTDRVVRGSVIDFVSVGVGPLRTAIFNVADVALMVGLALIVLGKNTVTYRVSSSSAGVAGGNK